ncbi:hypothetical protein [Runella slithyformis]|uniref:Toxin-antitoxin system YwqK family antitoxin n=1 Tax=Runella slithyformis (strain ATCC 29530 / DSM 19594 / LMG 11500 / NCIMB 11436 / LSU 4) TaxID=761193 RepID=A0A7U3ZQG6_RUNSL|nr:hypothetical protein [Runella slithyformis]AEI51500.1 hypothetical protein Runsl_5200 [Runella slithyformis DSM 19594]
MRRYLYTLIVPLLLFSFSVRSQEKVKTLVATSAWKRINTLPLFETEAEKPIAKEKNESRATDTADTQPTDIAANTSVPEKAPESDAKRSRRTKKTKAGASEAIAEQTAAADLKDKKNTFLPPADAPADAEVEENEPTTVSKRKKREKKPKETQDFARAETKPAAESLTPESAVKPKKKAPEPKPKADNTVTENTLSFQQVEGVKADLKPLESVEVMYFSKQNRYTKRENAYFYRKGQFDPRTRQPKGMVQDFYAGTDKPKFKGQYERYNNDDESNNNKYDGTCEFYSEDGAKSIRIYSKGRLTQEARFNKAGQPTAEAQYNFDGKRKNFKEFLFDENGTQIGTLIGGYDSNSGLEKATQQLFQNGKFHSAIEFIGGCPKNEAKFMDEDGTEYRAFFQDFTCEPDNLWKFTNSSNFEVTHRKPEKAYSIRSLQSQTGFLHLPVTHDFYKKSFEIEAVFDVTGQRSMTEFGIVWEYQDPQNYSYFTIDPVKQVYEINAVKEGTVRKYMTGINPQKLDLSEPQIKINYRKTGSEIFYTVNGQPLRFTTTRNTGLQTFNKSARVDLEKEYKTWNIGFLFKSQAPNESILLKGLKIKLK